MRQKVITAVVALVFGVLGMGLAFVAQHLWQDHQLLHGLAQIELQRQQAAQKPPPAQ